MFLIPTPARLLNLKHCCTTFTIFSIHRHWFAGFKNNSTLTEFYFLKITLQMIFEQIVQNLDIFIIKKKFNNSKPILMKPITTNPISNSIEKTQNLADCFQYIIFFIILHFSFKCSLQLENLSRQTFNLCIISLNLRRGTLHYKTKGFLLLFFF